MGQLSLAHLILLFIIIFVPFYLLKKLSGKSKSTTQSDNIEKIERLFELKRKGALTEEEFKIQKELLLKNSIR